MSEEIKYIDFNKQIEKLADQAQECDYIMLHCIAVNPDRTVVHITAAVVKADLQMEHQWFLDRIVSPMISRLRALMRKEK